MNDAPHTEGGFSGTCHPEGPGSHVPSRVKPWWQVGSDVTVTRNVTPVNGSGAYGNDNARGHCGGSSRPSGRGAR